MRHVVWVLAAVAVVVAAAWYVAGLPGQVSAGIAGYEIETSTPVAALGLAALLLVLHLLLRLAGAVLMLPRRLRGWRARRRREGGDQAVTRSLVALAAGGQDDARRQASRARKLLGDTPQTLLLAAEAGRLSGSEAEAEALYRALAAREDAAFLGLRGLFRQAMAREDWQEAAALARRAEAVQPGAAWLREERTRLAVRTADWGQALALAGPGAERTGFAIAAAEAETAPEQALRMAKRAWNDNPAFAPAALAYAKRLRAAGREARAQEVVRATWTLAPQPDLGEFALAPVSDGLARMKAAERLAAAAPDHAESHLLLARAALAAGLTGAARQHAEAALQGGLNQRRLWLLRADLDAAEHGDTAEALRRAALAEPDPEWRCDACGAVQTRWLPACPVCHTPGRMRWGGPARLAVSA